MRNIIGTLLEDGRKALAVNSTDNAWASLVPTATEPVGSATRAVFDTTMGNYAAVQDNYLLFAPFGAGTANQTMGVRVTGWLRASETLWTPFAFGTFTCTLGTMTGVEGQVITNTDLLADAIVQDDGNEEALNSDPPENTWAYAKLDIFGFSKIEFTFNRGSSATNGNVLFAFAT